jgi:hypothetical protein
MKTNKLPNPTAHGRCTTCGESDFTLAKDMTEYSPCVWNAENRTFSTVYGHMQESAADDAVRFFCTECGTQHMPPEGI